MKLHEEQKEQEVEKEVDEELSERSEIDPPGHQDSVVSVGHFGSRHKVRVNLEEFGFKRQ